MKIYFAPLEGITGYIYRNAYEEVYGGIDKYFTPFLTAGVNKAMSSRERSDISRENNRVKNLIPQILTNKSQDFCKLAGELSEMGYTEVNLNLGCPSKTVTTKKKGAGFLDYPIELNRFLEEIFQQNKIKISIKTRIGVHEEDEFAGILGIFNQYPLEELIIHPRLLNDYYNGNPRISVFEYGLQRSKSPVCYNGDICTLHDYKEITSRYPQLESVMIGRGFLKKPGFIKGGTMKQAEQFHGLVLEGYAKVLSGEKNVLFKMKEFWSYFIQGFEDGDKYAKQIRKTERIAGYDAIVEEVFRELRWNENEKKVW